jgi:hypothetical protein
MADDQFVLNSTVTRTVRCWILQYSTFSSVASAERRVSCVVCAMCDTTQNRTSYYCTVLYAQTIFTIFYCTGSGLGGARAVVCAIPYMRRIVLPVRRRSNHSVK